MPRRYLNEIWVKEMLAKRKSNPEKLRLAFSMKKRAFEDVMQGKKPINKINIDRLWKILGPPSFEDELNAFLTMVADHSKQSIADAADPVDRETARVQLAKTLRDHPGQTLYSSIGDARGILKLVDEFLAKEPLVRAIVLKKMSDSFLMKLEELGIVEPGLRERINANVKSLKLRSESRQNLKVEFYDWPALPPFYGLYYATYFRFGRWYVEDSNPPYLTVDNTPTWIFRQDAVDKHPLFIRYRDLITEVPTTKPRDRAKK